MDSREDSRPTTPILEDPELAAIVYKLKRIQEFHEDRSPPLSPFPPSGIRDLSHEEEIADTKPIWLNELPLHILEAICEIPPGFIHDPLSPFAPRPTSTADTSGNAAKEKKEDTIHQNIVRALNRINDPLDPLLSSGNPFDPALSHTTDESPLDLSPSAAIANNQTNTRPADNNSLSDPSPAIYNEEIQTPERIFLHRLQL